MYTKSDQNYDLGNKPTIINIHKEVCSNNYFRKAIWTGEHLQVTVMSIPAGGEIGLEMHDNLDQFIRIEWNYISSVTSRRDKIGYSASRYKLVNLRKNRATQGKTEYSVTLKVEAL